MKRLLPFFVVALSCVLILCSCGKNNPLSGRWKQVDGDGTLAFTEESVTVNGVEYLADQAEYDYEQGEEGTLVITVGGEKETIAYTLKDNTLTITYRDTTDTYVRVTDGNTKETQITTAPENKEETTISSEPTDEQIKASIIGLWRTEYKGSKLVYQFNEDGTGMASLFPMTYTVGNGVITVTVSAFGQTETGSASYSATENTLTLQKDGDTIVMQRTTMEELKND